MEYFSYKATYYNILMILYFCTVNNISTVKVSAGLNKVLKSLNLYKLRL